MTQELDRRVEMGMGRTKPLRDCTGDDLHWAAEYARRKAAHHLRQADAAESRHIDRLTCDVEVEPGVWCGKRAVVGDPHTVGSFRCRAHEEEVLLQRAADLIQRFKSGAPLPEEEAGL